MTTGPGPTTNRPSAPRRLPATWVLPKENRDSSVTGGYSKQFTVLQDAPSQGQSPGHGAQRSIPAHKAPVAPKAENNNLLRLTANGKARPKGIVAQTQQGTGNINTKGQLGSTSGERAPPGTWMRPGESWRSASWLFSR